MNQSSALREQFEQLAESLASCADEEVLSALVDARESGLISKGLDEQINRLRAEEVTPEEVVEWVKGVAGGASSEEIAEDSSMPKPISGESRTVDARPSDAEAKAEEQPPEIEPDQILEESEVVESSGMFDDLGDLMAEAGQKAIDDAPALKLPKLKLPSKLSGDAKKKLSKKFSLPKTGKKPALKPPTPSVGNQTPIAGLEAIQGLVANSAKEGTAPSTDDEFGFDDLDLDDMLAGAADDEVSGEVEREEPSEAEPVEPIEDESEPMSAELLLDSVAEEDEEGEEEEGDEDDDLGFDFGLDDDDEDDAPAGAAVDDDSDSGFGAGSGMGSLFDDDELAEIEGAGKKDPIPPTTENSTPGARYDSGTSGARYAGKAPPPPTHRLRSGSAPGPAMTGFEVESESDEDGDDFDLDFGFQGPTGSFASANNAQDSSGADEEEEDDFEFDLGLSNPEEKSSAVPGVPLGQESSVSSDDDDDDFEFDLGFDNPANKIEQAAPAFDLDEDSGATSQIEAGDVTKGPPALSESKTGSSTEEREDYDDLRKQAVRSDVIGDGGTRDYQPTPMRMPAVQSPHRPTAPTPIAQDRTGGGAASIDEDEFESLAASFAEEVPDQRYRGEPMLLEPSESEVEEMTASPDGNPFAHEAPTGVRHSAVESSSFVLEEVSAAESDTSTNLSAILLEARRLYENGEFEPAMAIVQKILSREDNDEATELKHAIEGELERVELDKLGSLAKVPTLKVAMSDIGTIDLDHRAGFLLSQVDGMMSFEDLLELSAMSRFETLTVLADLVEKGVIEAN